MEPLKIARVKIYRVIMFILVIIFLMVLFPPWNSTRPIYRGQVTQSLGYDFLFDPPELIPRLAKYSTVKIDIQRFLFQCTLVIIFGSGIILYFWFKNDIKTENRQPLKKFDQEKFEKDLATKNATPKEKNS